MNNPEKLSDILDKTNKIELKFECKGHDYLNCVYGKKHASLMKCEHSKNEECYSTVAVVNKMCLFLKRHDLEIKFKNK